MSFYDLQLVVIILPILTMYYFFSISSFFWKYSSFLNYFTSFLYNNVRVFSLKYAFSSCLIYNMPVILIFLSILFFHIKPKFNKHKAYTLLNKCIRKLRLFCKWLMGQKLRAFFIFYFFINKCYH